MIFLLVVVVVVVEVAGIKFIFNLNFGFFFRAGFPYNFFVAIQVETLKLKSVYYVHKFS